MYLGLFWSKYGKVAILKYFEIHIILFYFTLKGIKSKDNILFDA